MPVDISNPESLNGFFSHLSDNGTHEAIEGAVVGVEPHYDTEFLEFEKGVIFADGRIDLCKMVTGPTNIAALVASLKTNTFAKHFLLGNNIIGPTGAGEIATFIHEHPNRFETWYLAGNCIDAASFTLLVNAMITSASITNIWLKRNPLTSLSSTDIAHLIIHCPSLQTLDLDQTELGDEGAAALFTDLAVHNAPIALRHIYLNANGLHRKACAAISTYLSSPHCRLESLYLSSNPLGSSASLLAPGLASTSTLSRLVMQSCGLNDTSIAPILTALPGHPSLKVLDIGQYFATKDLNGKYNWFTDTSAESFTNLANTTDLQLFHLGHQPMSQIAINDFIESIISHSSSLLAFHIQPLVKGGRTYPEIRAGTCPLPFPIPSNFPLY
jgi:hypothetical protein